MALVRFTIVTPSFKQLNWLQLCIASVQDQVGSDVIVGHIIQDAGTPGIEDFAREHKANFYRDGEEVFRSQHSMTNPQKAAYSLTVYSEKDAGMYDAINKGLRRATGDVCAYLNCDEQYLSGTLTRVREFFQNHTEVDVLFGDALVIGPNGQALCYWRPYVPTLRHLAVATLNTLSCATFFRKSLIAAGHLFDPQWKTVSDRLWVGELLEKKRKLRSLREPLTAFTFLGNNLGAGRVAEEEFLATSTEQAPFRRLLSRGYHAGRKFASGAYVRRKVQYAVFTEGDSKSRKSFTVGRLGWTWPSV